MKTTKNQEQTTIKEEKKRNFIILYDSVYKNNNLTSDEIHLLIKLVAKAPNFKPTSRKLADILKIDLKTLNKASKGLQAKGYLKIKKFGNKSEWIINQEPHIADIKHLTKENLLNKLFTYEISYETIDELHRLKYIDDRLYIEITEDYTKELIRLAHYNAYED